MSTPKTTRTKMTPIEELLALHGKNSKDEEKPFKQVFNVSRVKQLIQVDTLTKTTDVYKTIAKQCPRSNIEQFDAATRKFKLAKSRYVKLVSTTATAPVRDNFTSDAEFNRATEKHKRDILARDDLAGQVKTEPTLSQFSSNGDVVVTFPAHRSNYKYAAESNPCCELLMNEPDVEKQKAVLALPEFLEKVCKSNIFGDTTESDVKIAILKPAFRTAAKRQLSEMNYSKHRIAAVTQRHVLEQIYILYCEYAKKELSASSSKKTSTRFHKHGLSGIPSLVEQLSKVYKSSTDLKLQKHELRSERVALLKND